MRSSSNRSRPARTSTTALASASGLVSVPFHAPSPVASPDGVYGTLMDSSSQSCSSAVCTTGGGPAYGTAWHRLNGPLVSVRYDHSGDKKFPLRDKLGFCTMRDFLASTGEY